jgi:hypothetical protein
MCLELMQLVVGGGDAEYVHLQNGHFGGNGKDIILK